MKRFKLQARLTHSPECKVRLQNQSGRWGSSRVASGRYAQANFPTNRPGKKFYGSKGLVGPPGLEPGTNRL
jgi:hypothetical protein